MQPYYMDGMNRANVDTVIACYEDAMGERAVAVNNHKPLVKMLDIALDAIGDAVDAGITMGGISPETFQEGRVLLADIDKESAERKSPE